MKALSFIGINKNRFNDVVKTVGVLDNKFKIHFAVLFTPALRQHKYLWFRGFILR